MGTLTIRNLDEKTLEHLKQRAAANHRSLEAEVRALLENIASRSTREASVQRARVIRSMTPPGPPIDSTRIIREWRDREGA